MAIVGSSAAMVGTREGSFGYPVADDIIKQLEVRGDIFAKESKFPQDLTYIHSNAPWIMFRSGVDTPSPKVLAADVVVGQYNLYPRDPDKTSSLGTNSVQYSAEAAKHCVLVGGLGVSRDSGKIGLAAGLGELVSNPAYRVSSTMGYRPIPGITGISVKTKDTWGAIMEAEISIQVWSKEDLAVIDQLFFKPGMTALLEWGHSIWVNNEGRIHRADSTMPLSGDWFFTSHDFNEIDEIIQERRNQFNGNYEACFGYITNFSYSFNGKGGYDCTVKMLSKSSVLEGLQIAKVRTGTEGKKSTRYHNLFTYWIENRWKREILKSQDFTVERIQAWEKEKGVQSSSSQGKVAERYAEISERKRQEKGIRPSLPISEEDLALLRELDITLYKVPVKTTDYSGWHNFWYNSTDKFKNLVYISLRDLLKIIQTVNNIREFSDREGIVQFDLNSQNEYVTFGEHFSLNPYVAAVPHKPREFTNAFVLTGPGTETFSTTVFDTGIENSTEIQQTLPRPVLNSFTQILNIPVSVNNFLGVLDELLNSETENFSLFKVLNTLLADIQKAFGNINDFGLHYNTVDGLWSIVDRNYPRLWTNESKGPGKICVSGLRTTLNKLSVNSAVSPSVTNEMTIAAQAPLQENTDTINTEASPSIVNWNEGCINRHRVSNVEIKPGHNLEKEEIIPEIQISFVKNDFNDFKTKVENFYKTVNDLEVLTEAGENLGDYANQEYSNIYLQGESIFRKILNRDVDTETTEGTLYTGVIPVKVELEMLGISRFVIGTSFRVSPGILLPKYDNWGYIVTGVENKVSSSGWTTHLRTQYFPVLNSKKSSVAVSLRPSASENYDDYPTWEDIKDRPAMYWKGKLWRDKVKPMGITPNMVDSAAVPLAESRGLFITVPASELPGVPVNLTCNRAIVTNLKAVFAEIQRTAPEFKINTISCRRNNDSVSNRYDSSKAWPNNGTSTHCFGVAIDINGGSVANPWFDCKIQRTDVEPKLGAKGPVSNPLGKCKMYSSPMNGYNPATCIWHYNHPVVKAFEKYGWGWGGSYGDVMHFSLADGH